MLEQTTPMTGSLHSLLEIDATVPLSVSAPRAAAVTMNSPSRSADRLSEMVARAEMLLLHLESRLNDERSASERAARTTAEMEDRLRLGVRMLQAFDVQVARSEQSSNDARTLIEEADARMRTTTQGAEEAVRACVDGVVREKFDWIERELAWRFDRVKEVEERIEQAANGKLAWLDAELGQRLGRMNEACAQAEQSLSRAEGLIAQLSGATEMLDRAERVSANLSQANAESSRQIETLSQRTGEATAMREAIGTMVHEVAASREVVAGELRRMRDDLFWLTDRGERISTDLVERADSAAACSQSLRAQVDAATPMLKELAAWIPLINGDAREKIGPIAEAIAGRVRDTLSTDMRGFSLAMRHFADRADHAFLNVRLDPALLDPSSMGAVAGAAASDAAPADAKSLATELSRLIQRSAAHAATPAPAVSSAPVAIGAPVDFIAPVVLNAPAMLNTPVMLNAPVMPNAPAVPSAQGARSAQPQIVSARLTAVVAANKPLEL